MIIENINIKNIDIENIDIKKLYKYQLDHEDNVEYAKYLKYLSLFYEKENKKSKYSKEYDNGKYILIDKKNPNKKITIIPSKFININDAYINFKERINIILYRISELIETKNNITNENRDQFELLKKDYKLFKENMNDINDINNDYFDKISDLIDDKINKANNMVKYYKQRNEIYSNIEIMIPEECKNKLIKLYKDNKNKIPSISILNKIAKEYKIPSKEIEKWSKWIEAVYFYRLASIEIEKINKELLITEKDYLHNSSYMIIKKPEIEE
jgi:hypothetical protein